MRKLVYAINQTLDGCYDHTAVTPDESLMDYWTNIMNQAGLVIYGRVTYQLMMPFWPDMARARTGSKQELDFADAFSSRDKVVFSRSLKKIEDENTTLMTGDLKEEIIKLKQGEGRDMYLGGISIPSQLMALGLVDEFLFVVHPVIAGHGRRLMEGVDFKKSLTMRPIGSEKFASGVIALRYAKI